MHGAAAFEPRCVWCVIWLVLFGLCSWAYVLLFELKYDIKLLFLAGGE
jgi:hypothetical protein